MWKGQYQTHIQPTLYLRISGSNIQEHCGGWLI